MNCIFLDLFKEFWLSVTLMMIRLKTFVLLREYMRKVFGDLNWRETRCPLMSIWIRESRQIIVFMYPFLLNGYLGHFFYLYSALICTMNGFIMFLPDEQNKMTSPIEIHSYTMRTIEAFVWEELVTLYHWIFILSLWFNLSRFAFFIAFALW